MKVVTVFVLLCFGATIISADLISDESVESGESDELNQWWNGWSDYYLQFNSPSGKRFYIDFRKNDFRPDIDETIHEDREDDEPEVDLKEKPAFITFIAMDLKVYHIYFDNDDLPRIEESIYSYNRKTHLIKHRLDSFVGPNKKLFKVIYNDNNEPSDLTVQSSRVYDHFQIRTIGAYDKWENTYDFTKNGEFLVDHKRSPIAKLPNRSIALPKLDRSTFLDDTTALIVEFNTPSGVKYHVTNHLDIIQIRQDNYSESGETAYITFTEPNQRTYDIYMDKEDGHPFLVEKMNEKHDFQYGRLYSFVAPNRILYRIDNQDETVPILVSNSSEPMELQITVTYSKYVKYIFSDNGAKLFDRVDEIDGKALNEHSTEEEQDIEEVDADYVKANLPFLTFYAPSGNNYHIFTNETTPRIAFEKGTTKSQPLYITYFQTNGTKTHIYFSPGDDPYIEEEYNVNQQEVQFSFFLQSFVTPDHKQYEVIQHSKSPLYYANLGYEPPNFELEQLEPEPVTDYEPSYELEPESTTEQREDQLNKLPSDSPHLSAISLSAENGLTIKISADGHKFYTYRFTWTDYQFITVTEEYNNNIQYIPPPALLKSLVGK